jgi:transglutaminase-like putative cysteine protease
MNSRKLFAALSLAIVLVGLQVEAWVLVLGILFLGWKAAVEFGGLAKPSRWLTNSLTVIFLALILAKYRSLAGQESSSSFLLLLTSLKLLEERTLRDQKFSLLLGFVLLSSLFLFTLELPSLIGGVVAFYILWTAQNSSLTYRQHFLKALPYVVFLFLFFPRVQNPFGLRAANAGPGSTGFSDDLNPGSISKIQTSHELAFRVQFLKPVKVRTRDQYWRGQILRFHEGLRWSKKPTSDRRIDRATVKDLDYEVILEPHGNRWVFTWDPTSQLQTRDFSFFTRDTGVFESFGPLRDRVTYQGKIAPPGPSESENYKIDLQISLVPDSVRDFALKVKEQYKTRDAIVEEFLNHFRREKFYYTKNPGLGSNTIENFLFKNKKGYCEHYAATMASLLRLAGVPARVVTGYQGGQYNAYGKFWRFTQADAHAWVEYLNDNDQWERTDPTSVIAPERIEFGGLLFEDLPEDWIGQNKGEEFLRSREAWWVRSKDFLRDTVESLNYDIVIFLIDFNLERQKELLSQYGLWALLVGVLLLSPFMLQSFFRRQKESEADWLRKSLEGKAKDFQITRKPSETVRHFVERWKNQQPGLGLTLDQLLRVYEGAEYAKSFAGFNPKEVRNWLKSLKASPRHP